MCRFSFLLNLLFFGIEILAVEADVGDSRVDRHHDHNACRYECDGRIGRDPCGRTEGLVEEWLDECRDDADDLRNGLDLTRQVCRHVDVALSRNEKADRGDCKLAEEDDKQTPEHEGKVELIVSVLNEKRQVRADDEKLIGNGVEELSEVCYEVTLSCDLAVEHVGKRGQREEHETHDGKDQVKGRVILTEVERDEEHTEGNKDDAENCKLIR